MDILRPYNVSDTINEVIGNYKLIHSNLKINHMIIMQNKESKLAIPEEQLRQVFIIILIMPLNIVGKRKKLELKRMM